jgi:hypothetical protein
MSSGINFRIIILWISIRLLAAKLKHCGPLGMETILSTSGIRWLPRYWYYPGCGNPISLLVFIFIVEIDQVLRLQVFGSGCDGEINAIVEGSKFRESHVLKILS